MMGVLCVVCCVSQQVHPGNSIKRNHSKSATSSATHPAATDPASPLALACCHFTSSPLSCLSAGDRRTDCTIHWCTVSAYCSVA